MKKPNMAICFCSVGNGHFTQALTIANYMKDKYKTTLIVATCLSDCDEELLTNNIKNSILFKDKGVILIAKANALSTHDLRNKYKMCASVLYYTTINISRLTECLKQNKVNIIIDCYTNFLDVYDIPVISISRQLISVNALLDNVLYRTLKQNNKRHYNSAICLTRDDIQFAKHNKIIDFAIPPLIDVNPIERVVIPNTCLLYLRDKDYCSLVDQLVVNNPNTQFTIFTNYTGFIKRNANVNLNKPGPEFKECLTPFLIENAHSIDFGDFDIVVYLEKNHSFITLLLQK